MGRTFSLVLTSPRLRARRSAELAGYPEAEVDDDLAEWAYGRYEGVSTARIRETDPGWTIWSHPAPGGETADAVCERVDRVIRRARSVGRRRPALRARALPACARGARWLGRPVTEGGSIASTPGRSRSSATNARPP